MTRLRLATLFLALAPLAGCDANPGGPSAPSPAPADPGKGDDPAKEPPNTLPLKKVGAPIG